MKQIMVVSPHYDDVPLSLGQSLTNGDLAESSVSVRVAFGRTNWSVRLHPTRGRAGLVTRWRLLEEQRAARSFGYSVKAENFEEAILRNGSLDPETFRGDVDPSADQVYSDVLLRLRVYAVQAQELWVPSGLGRHTDHRIVAMAAAELVRDGVDSIVFYEDRPYVSFLNDAEIADQLSILGLDLQPEDVSPVIEERTQARVRRIYRSQMNDYFYEAQQHDLDKQLCERVWIPARSADASLAATRRLQE